MATYKVIQDIEAEDHILGPLSLRQFIYGLIAAFLLYVSFICITKGAAFLLVVLLPPAAFCAFFAFPFGGEQPTEVWALAKLRFLFKPRKRIWNQSGIKELVTITVPKRIELQLTDGLSQTEVKSRLQALANTIDSRGWAIKNITSNYTPYAIAGQGDSDRLINIGSMPQAVADADTPDMLDDRSSPLAQQFDSMITTSTQNRRKQLIDQLNEARSLEAAKQTAPQQQWFAQPAMAAPQPVSQPATPSADADFMNQIKEGMATQAQVNAKLRTIPTSQSAPIDTPEPPVIVPAQAQATSQVTPTTDPAILNLAKNNDLNVATLAREANKAKELGDDDEVVIALH